MTATASNTAARPSDTPDPALRLLDEAITRVRRAERDDLVVKLERKREQLASDTWHVLVAGEFKKGKSALVNGLLGVPLCGEHPVAFTAVPTLVRHGPRPAATVVPETGTAPAARPNTVDIRRVAEYARRGSGDDGRRISSIEVTLPRKLLSTGMVLVDSPGMGGGFASAAAASTMRAMSMAVGVIVVTDASQELTSAEVEFITEAANACPNLLCVLTKTDYYPRWQRILELDRGHLAAAGVEADVIAVSSTLREAALDTGSRALNAESGFPVLADRIKKRMADRQRTLIREQAAATVHDALRQVSDSLRTEHATLADPSHREETLRRVTQAEQRAKEFVGPSSRWLNVINDDFADIQSSMDADLTERVRRLEAEATRRIKEGDPTREWAEIVPWMYRRTNEELTDAHTQLTESIDKLADRISGLFDDPAPEDDRRGPEGMRPSDQLKLTSTLTQRGGKLETGMHAARGLSLSSSVITTLLITTLNAPFLVFLPVTAALGGIFAVKAVRSYKTSKVDQARAEATRAVVNYLHQARTDAQRASMDLIRHSRVRLRDYYLDRAAEMVSAARHEQEAATRAARQDTQTATRRGAEVKAELERVTWLAEQARRISGDIGGGR